MDNRKTKHSFVIVALGVAFEHFDMMLVSLLASSIVAEYVSSGGPALTLLYAYIGYAIAFLFRPLGALCFGCIGDLYGRKASLIGSLTLMSTATLALALIPIVRVLGVTSTGLFLLCRIAQGLAVGGEYGTAMTYSYEFNPRRRTFYGACVVSSTHIGGVFASLLASQFVDNFRVAFFVGGMIGFLLLLFRSYIKEHPVTKGRTVSEVATDSVRDKGAIVQGLVVASLLVLVFYGSLIYVNELVHQRLEIPRSKIFHANSLLLGLWILLPPCVGYLTDKYQLSYHQVMRFGALGVFFSAPLLGLAFVMSSYPAVLAAQGLMHLFHMLFCLCTPRFFGDLFTGHARNTAISTSYSMGASFTSALAPMICNGSILVFQTSFAICVPFMVMALATIYVLKKGYVCKKTIHLSSTTYELT